MRKLTLLLLFATAAAPALAQDRDRSGRQPRSDAAEQLDANPQREGRNSARSGGGQGTERGGGDGRRGFERLREQRLQTATTTTTDTSGTIPSGGVDRVRIRPDGGSDGVGGGETVRVRRGDGNGTATSQPSTNWRERERRVRTLPDTQPSARTPVQVERKGLEHRRRDYRDGRYTRWSDGWHRDRRYDWRRYRDDHRSIFRLGTYHDPFGWNYRRWAHGSYLYPSYYRSSFWLNDPWHYRLPAAYGPYRWVRYWNDALLVNIYTGEVVDVMHSFFW